ncbi:interactor of HORMAD1 protein 1 [Aulostomus maculatus]
MSQDQSLSSRNSQQSSQEGSEPKFSSIYHSKPLLFGESDKSKVFGILDKFEEERKKAKEKTDSDNLTKECLQIREALTDIQQLIAGTDKNTSVGLETVLEKFNNFSSTLQNNFNSLQSDISQQLEALLHRVNSQKDTIAELGERVQKSGDTSVEVGSNIQSLKRGLESVREEQERELRMLEEALKLLNSLVSENSAKICSERGTDTAIQTSPAQDNKLESQQSLSSINLEQNQVEVPTQDRRGITGRRKSTLRVFKRGKKRPLVPRSRRHVQDENSKPLMKCNKHLNSSAPLCLRQGLKSAPDQGSLKPDSPVPLSPKARSSETAGCLITPLSCWSQDSNSSPTGIDSVLEKLSSESKIPPPGEADGFWQLFGTDCYSGINF